MSFGCKNLEHYAGNGRLIPLHNHGNHAWGPTNGRALYLIVSINQSNLGETCMPRIYANLPKWVVEELDNLADETDTSIQEVLKQILEHVLNDEALVDEIFPTEED